VQPAGWRSRDGRLWFPTVHGLAVVDPAALRRNETPPPVVIEDVRVEYRPLEARTDVALAPGTERIEFAFIALSLANPEAVRYRYRLEGYEADWSDVQAGRVARYTHLDPGRYTFRVMAMNGDGVWNEAGAAFAFYLRPFFWQTPWFWLVAVLLVGAGGVSGHRLRVRQLEARQRHLEQVVAERTHDLQSAKEQIEAQAGALRASLTEKEVLLREIHHRVKNNLQIIASLLHLQAQKVSDPDVVRLFKECRARISSMSMIHERLYQSESLSFLDFGAYLRGITGEAFRLYRPGDRVALRVVAAEAPLGIDQAIPCGLILNELVSNALKYAFPGDRTGVLAVTFAAEDHRYRLVVEDDGVGLPPGFVPGQGRSLGLKLVEALAGKLHGHVTAGPAGGTASGARFELVFPAREAPLDAAVRAPDSQLNPA
jgi:two-component sensor histidine kinase